MTTDEFVITYEEILNVLKKDNKIIMPSDVEILFLNSVYKNALKVLFEYYNEHSNNFDYSILYRTIRAYQSFVNSNKYNEEIKLLNINDFSFNFDDLIKMYNIYKTSKEHLNAFLSAVKNILITTGEELKINTSISNIYKDDYIIIKSKEKI